MKPLIKTNIKKTLSMKSFYVCFGIIIVIGIVFGIIDQVDFGHLMGEEMKGIDVGNGVGYSFTEAITCSNTAAIALYFGIFVVMFVMGEISICSYKNIIPQGFSKSKIYLGLKAYVSGAVLLCLVIHSTLYALINTILGGDPIDKRLIRFVQIMLTIGAQALLLAAVMSCIITVCFVFMNTGICIMVHFLFLNVVHTVLENLSLSNPHNNIVNSLIYVHPSNALEAITTDTFKSNDIIHAIILAICYLVISDIVGLVVFNKRDI